MDAVLTFLQYFGDSWPRLLHYTYQHILVVFYGIALALIIGVPLGTISAKNKKLASVIIPSANVIQVLPALALLVILMLLFGIGFTPVIICLFLYSLLPIIRNTYVGLSEVDPNAIKAGKGMGMSRLQLLAKVEFPLALPFLLAGFRVAVVIGIGVATLAPFIGGEGLGKEIYSGINTQSPVKIYGGALIASLMAIFADYLIGRLQSRLRH